MKKHQAQSKTSRKMPAEQVFALNFPIEVLKAFKVVAMDEEYLLFSLKCLHQHFAGPRGL